MKLIIRLAASSALVLLTLTAAACNDALQVENLSNPDVDRVFALPATIEQTLGTGYQSCRNALQTSDRMQQLETMSLESYSSLNNFFMGPRGGMPRGPILNDRTASSNFTPFSALSRQARTAVNALAALDKLLKSNGTLGTAARDARAKSWGFFVAACNLGYLALTYDSSAVVSVGMPSDSTPPLAGSKEVMAAAIAFLDSAEIIASSSAAGGSGGFPTTASWLSGATLTRDQFLRWVRSWRARFRAGNARTPEERAALDWNKIVADATSGLTSDVVVSVGGSTGWNLNWIGNQMHVDAAWHQITPMIFGMADTSGGYDRFLSKPLAERDGYFLILTPDQRFPWGSTRAQQQDHSPNRADYQQLPYVENRKITDTPGDAWGSSFYNYYKYKYYQRQSNTGQFPEFRSAEVDLLAAEGYIRLGNYAAAAALIDKTRIPALLPSVAGVTGPNDPVPGADYDSTFRIDTTFKSGNIDKIDTVHTGYELRTVAPGKANCVPRVPVGPNFTTTACGNLFEAMKWEKRMELAYEQFGAWFWDARGWGDLPTDTALEYPTPYEELDARLHPFWNLGGGGPSSAKKGTYGF